MRASFMTGTAMPVADACYPLSLESDRGNLRTDDHSQIGAAHRQPQKRHCAGAAAAMARCGKIGTDAVPFTGWQIAAWHLRLTTDVGKGPAQLVMVGAGVIDLHVGALISPPGADSMPSNMSAISP